MNIQKFFFNKELEQIISQGDCSQEYRNLFKKIVLVHRKIFTEENIPTTEGYLQELLKDAIEEASLVEERELKISRLERELEELRGIK